MVSVPKTRPAYPEQFRREAIELLRAGRSPRELSESLGVSQQTLRNWRRQEQVDRHERDDGLTSDEREELRRLRRENARLTQEAAISGLVRRKRGRTTIRVPGVRVADDLVERRFRPGASNVLWIADVTYLAHLGLAVPGRRPGRLLAADR